MDTPGATADVRDALPDRIRDAVEVLRPFVGSHPCAEPIYGELDDGASHSRLIEVAGHLVTCESGHYRSGSQGVMLDLLATILDYGHAAPQAHPVRALGILGHAHGRAYAAAIAAVWSDTPSPTIEDLLDHLAGGDR